MLPKSSRRKELSSLLCRMTESTMLLKSSTEVVYAAEEWHGEGVDHPAEEQRD